MSRETSADTEAERPSLERSTRLTGLRRLSGRTGIQPLPSWIIGLVVAAIAILFFLVITGAVDPPAL